MPNARWLSRPQPQTHTFLSLGHIPHHFWYSSGFPFTCFLILFQQTFFFFFLWLSQHFHIYLSKSFYSLTQARVASLHTSDPQGSWGSESLGMSELIQIIHAPQTFLNIYIKYNFQKFPSNLVNISRPRLAPN